MSENLITCPYCDEQMEDDPGAYYHEADCHRRDALARLATAKLQGADAAQIDRLQDEVERASYVGD